MHPNLILNGLNVTFEHSSVNYFDMRFITGSCFVLLFGTIHLYGQSNTKVDHEWVFNNSALVHKEINLSTKAQPVSSFPYLEKIEVIDLRSDTLGIGFKTRNSEKKNTLFVLNGGLKTAFGKFISSTSKFNSSNNGYTAHVVVKEFWLKEFEADEDDKDKVLDKSGWNTVNKKSSLKIYFDFYLSKDEEYFAAYRFDTLAIGFLNINEFTDAYLSGILHYSFARLQSIEPASYTQNKRKFSRSELVKYYQEKWNKPMLTDSQYVRGVYRSFSEFVNNRPSISNFVVRKDKLADVLYITEKGQEMTPIRDVWGYCDGKNLYIKSGENYFMLVRVQNSFYFLGSQELTKSRDDLNSTSTYGYDPFSNRATQPGVGVYTRNRLLPMKVDMEKGSVY
jgi:hypothetical protein